MKILRIIGSLIIILAVIWGTTYMITSITGVTPKPSWVTNDVDELKASANTQYQNTMKNYYTSVESVERDVQRIVNKHPGNTVNIETKDYELRKSGSCITVETDYYEYRKSGSCLTIETDYFEYRKSGSAVTMEYK